MDGKVWKWWIMQHLLSDKMVIHSFSCYSSSLCLDHGMWRKCQIVSITSRNKPEVIHILRMENKQAKNRQFMHFYCVAIWIWLPIISKPENCINFLRILHRNLYTLCIISRMRLKKTCEGVSIDSTFLSANYDNKLCVKTHCGVPNDFSQLLCR